jgi:hypothetical protein
MLTKVSFLIWPALSWLASESKDMSHNKVGDMQEQTTQQFSRIRDILSTGQKPLFMWFPNCLSIRTEHKYFK